MKTSIANASAIKQNFTILKCRHTYSIIFTCSWILPPYISPQGINLEPA